MEVVKVIKFLMSMIMVMSFNFSTEVLNEPLSVKEKTSFTTRSIAFDDQYERVVSGIPKEGDKRFIVNYELKDKDIYIECFIKDFIFSKDNAGSVKKEGEGHIHLFINDTKVDSIYKSSFIVKSLPSGTYKIRLELIHNDYTPYGISEEFEVTL